MNKIIISVIKVGYMLFSFVCIAVFIFDFFLGYPSSLMPTMTKTMYNFFLYSDYTGCNEHLSCIISAICYSKQVLFCLAKVAMAVFICFISFGVFNAVSLRRLINKQN